jgi:holin-like protein
MGMGLLFVLLASGLLRPHDIQEAVSLLLRHFAFFFIPISVGLMVWGALVVQHGIMLLCILLLSALVALATTGLTVHLLMRWRNIHE